MHAKYHRKIWKITLNTNETTDVQKLKQKQCIYRYVSLYLIELLLDIFLMPFATFMKVTTLRRSFGIAICQWWSQGHKPQGQGQDQGLQNYPWGSSRMRTWIKCFGEAPNTLHIYSVIGNGQNSKLLPLKSFVQNMQWLVKSVLEFFQGLESRGQGQGLDSQGQSQDQGLQNCPQGSSRMRTCPRGLQHCNLLHLLVFIIKIYTKNNTNWEDSNSSQSCKVVESLAHSIGEVLPKHNLGSTYLKICECRNLTSEIQVVKFNRNFLSIPKLTAMP